MRLAQIRKARGPSHVQLAEMAGVEQPAISPMGKGSDSVTLRLVHQVAAAFGVSLADLFHDGLDAGERFLVEAFRSLPPEPQNSWLDMAHALCESKHEKPWPEG